MNCYTFPSGHLPAADALRVFVRMPDYKPMGTIEITLREKPKVSRWWRRTALAGNKVPETITCIDDMVEAREDFPQVHVSHLTTAVDFEKINCIKQVRQATGWSLPEAKAFVEEMGRMGARITLWLHA